MSAGDGFAFGFFLSCSSSACAIAARVAEVASRFKSVLAIRAVSAIFENFSGSTVTPGTRFWASARAKFIRPSREAELTHSAFTAE